MSKFWVVTKQVYKKTVKSGGFIVLLLTPILFIAAMVGVGYLMTDKDSSPTVAVVSENNYYQKIASEMKSDEIKVAKHITTLKEAKQAMKNEKIDGYLVLKDSNKGMKIHYLSRDSSDKSVDATIVSGLFQSLKMNHTAQELGLSAKELAKLSAPVTVQKDIVSYDKGTEKIKTDDAKDVQKIVSTVFMFVTFMFIMIYAQLIAQEIASEKGSRVMEIILSSSSAATQFFGKITAIFLAAVTQVVLYAVLGIGAYQILKNQDFVKELLTGIDMHQIFVQIFGFASLLFILTIILYALLAAMLGSLVSRTEEVGQAFTPIMLLVMVGYFAGFTANMNPNQIFVKVCSYIPFFSSMVMPGRYSSGVVSAGNVWVSIIIMVLTIFLLTFIALKMYRANVLVYSDKGIMAAFKKSLSLMKSEKQVKNR